MYTQGIYTHIICKTDHQRTLCLYKHFFKLEERSNLVYGLTCTEGGCQETYVGETKQSVKSRLQQRRRPSTNDAQNSAVYKHIKDSGHNVECHDVIILDREKQWHKHGIKEAIWEKIEQPTLNKKGGLRFNLSHTWDRALHGVSSCLSRDQSKGLVA